MVVDVGLILKPLVRIVGGQSGQSFGHLVELKIEGRCSNKIKMELKSQLFYIVRIKIGPGEKY